MLRAFGSWSKVLRKDSWMGPCRQRCVVTEVSLCSKRSNRVSTHKSLTSVETSTTTGNIALFILSVLWMAICAQAIKNVCSVGQRHVGKVAERGVDHTEVCYTAALC